MSSLAPALLMQELDENLRKVHVNERDIRARLDDVENSSILHQSHQVCFTQHYFCQTVHHELLMNQLPVIFELNPRTVRKYLFRAPQDAQGPAAIEHWMKRQSQS
jgi:hypothetical protein